MKAAIIGYGKSGAAAEKLLRRKGVDDIEIFDDKSGKYPDISEYSGVFDITVVSPGVDRSKYGSLPDKVTSEIELAYEAMNKNARVIAVTGTNGKSTTTHLTAQILNNAGIKAIACGNIGYTFGDAVLEHNADVFVIELSSFQIELLNRFEADCGCIINITPDHIDRYGAMDSYRAAKLRLMNFIKKEGLFVSDGNPEIVNEAILHKFKARYIDSSFISFPKIDSGMLNFGAFHVNLSKFNLFGSHNIVNLSFALTMAGHICSFEGDVSYLLKDLSCMPHRTELIAEINGVKWINDSKATNVDSVHTALLSVRKPSFLFIGGRDKKSDYTPLAPVIKENISAVCYFGEAGELIKGQLSPLIKGVKEMIFPTLKDCVRETAALVSSGDTVILSPACTSFDEFSSYEDRGEKFKEYVLLYGGDI